MEKQFTMSLNFYLNLNFKFAMSKNLKTKITFKQTIKQQQQQNLCWLKFI